MKQGNQTINAHVEETEKDAYIVFEFDDPIKLCISSKDNEDTKKFFIQLINKIIVMKEIPQFELTGDVSGLYGEVSEKYLSQLNSEIEKCCNELDIFKE